MSDAYSDGAKAGRDIGKLAIDCPFQPADEPERRKEWLAGFSSTRANVSPSSDPEQAEGASAPEHQVRTTGPKHEG